jgi:hypothetical protein
MSIQGFPPCKCARHGCLKQAQFIPVICVPAKSNLVRIDTSNTEVYRSHLNIPLCDKHSKTCNAQDFASERLIEMFAAQAKSRGKPPPDFSRVYLTIESMSAPGYQAILKLEAEKQKKGFVLQ